MVLTRAQAHFCLVMPKQPPPNASPEALAAKAARNARESEALRANLRKRKEQARMRAQDGQMAAEDGSLPGERSGAEKP